MGDNILSLYPWSILCKLFLIRSNCDYVLHSSGQLFSHKRKHERKDNELAYRKYKLAQSMINPGAGGQNGMFPFPATSPGISSDLNENSNSLERPPSSSGSITSGSSSPPLLPVSESNGQIKSQLSQPLPPSSTYGGDIKRGETGPFPQIPQNVPDDAWQQYLLRFEEGEGCGFQDCELEDLEHFHCKDEGCETVFRAGQEEAVREHGRMHFQQDFITDAVYNKVDPEEPGSDEACPPNCPYRTKEIHYHCKWVSVEYLSHEVIPKRWNEK